MREAEVVAAFCVWLERDGWTNIRQDVDHVDIVAERGEERLFAEAKGVTKAIGLDMDTMHGQILRRMPIGEDPSARFAVVVPERSLDAALRVGQRVRDLLGITIYYVDEIGEVRPA